MANISSPAGATEAWLRLLVGKLFGIFGIAQAGISANIASPLDGAGNVKVDVVTFTGAPGPIVTRMETYTLRTGEVAGAVAATQFPQLACKLCRVKAQNDNAGNVYIGGVGVTVAAGTTDTTTGWQLDAGEETPWLLITDMNQLFRICDNAGDDVTYIAMV
jgi:hypothetical protein